MKGFLRRKLVAENCAKLLIKPHELRYRDVSAILFREIVANRPPDGLKVQFFSQDAANRPPFDLFADRLRSWPHLGKSIGLGYVPRSLSEIGQALTILIRGKGVAAEIVETPFG